LADIKIIQSANSVEVDHRHHAAKITTLKYANVSNPIGYSHFWEQLLPAKHAK